MQIQLPLTQDHVWDNFVHEALADEMHMPLLGLVASKHIPIHAHWHLCRLQRSTMDLGLLILVILWYNNGFEDDEDDLIMEEPSDMEKLRP